MAAQLFKCNKNKLYFMVHKLFFNKETGQLKKRKKENSREWGKDLTGRQEKLSCALFTRTHQGVHAFIPFAGVQIPLESC